MMGGFVVNGLEEIELDLAALAALPDSVTDEMLNAGADVLVKAQQDEARKMLVGEYATGTTAASIKKGKIKKKAGEKSISVYPQGKNAKGVRNAEVAFINEYGKRGQPARPFIRTANEKAEQEAVQAGEKVYNDHLDSKNL